MKDQNVRVQDPDTGRMAVVTLSVDETDAQPVASSSIVRAVWEENEVELSAEEIADIEHLVEEGQAL